MQRGGLKWLWCVWLAMVGWTPAVWAGDDAKLNALYFRVEGGQEEYQVKKGDRLPQIALQKGVRWRVLAKKNNLKNPNKLSPGTVLKIKNTYIIPTDLEHGLLVNLPELKLYLFDQGVLKHRYPLAVGKSDWQTPTGNYKILNKVKNPTWTVPISIQEEMEEMGMEVVTKVPPGPKNPLGAFWMATSAPGVGIHATTRPWSIGHYASHGCIRMLPKQIEELFPQVQVGMPVTIIYKPIKLAYTTDQRIFLEVHPDVYRKVSNLQAAAEALIKKNLFEDLVDWQKVKQVVKARDGVAEDITRHVEAEPVMGQNVPAGGITPNLGKEPGT